MKKEDLNLILELHSKWLNNDPNGQRANLQGVDLQGVDLRSANLLGANLLGANLLGANLRNADLRNADLRNADLWGVSGNMAEIKSMFIEQYPVTYTSEELQIGCQKHKITEWWEFTDEEILKMDGKNALRFWRKFKEHIKQTIELSPATPKPDKS